MTASRLRGKAFPNEYPGYDTKKSNSEAAVMQELWEMRIIPSLPSLPCSLWLEVVAPDSVLSMGQIELNCVIMLNWIARNRTVLIFKLRTYAKINCLKRNSFSFLNWIVWTRTIWQNWIAGNRNVFWQFCCLLMVNWMVWNRTAYLYKNEFGIQ